MPDAAVSSQPGSLAAPGERAVRGAALRWPDVVDNAGAFASALGFTVLTDGDDEG